MVGTLVMAPKCVTFRRHDHLVSVLFGDSLSHSYNITFSMFLDLVMPRCTMHRRHMVVRSCVGPSVPRFVGSSDFAYLCKR